MNVTTYTDPAAFHAATHAWLEAQESVNILLLGVCGQLLQQPERYPLPPHLFSVEDDDGLRLVTLMTPSHRMITSLARGDPAEPTAALVTSLREAGVTIPDVIGPSESSAALAAAWAQASGQQFILHTRLRAYELRSVNPLPQVRGNLRPTNEADTDLVVRWHYDFSLEALGQANKTEIKSAVSLKIRNGYIFLWEDDWPGLMATAKKRGWT